MHGLKRPLGTIWANYSLIGPSQVFRLPNIMKNLILYQLVLCKRTIPPDHSRAKQQNLCCTYSCKAYSADEVPVALVLYLKKKKGEKVLITARILDNTERRFRISSSLPVFWVQIRSVVNVKYQRFMTGPPAYIVSLKYIYKILKELS
jgi:hypothetical protein